MEEMVLSTSYTPAVITADFDAMRAKLDAFMEPYRDMDDAALAEMSRKELADQRTAVNSLIKSVEDGRKAVKKAYNEPLAAFEKKVKELLEPAKAASEQLSEHIDRKDAIVRDERKAQLKAYYAEIAGVLAEHIPFERVFDPDWVKSQAKYKAAFDTICDKCKRLADDWAALKKMELFDFADAERNLFETFDLRGTIERDDAKREQAERLDAMKADLGMGEQEPYEPPAFEEVGPKPVVKDANADAPAYDAPYRKHYRFKVWLSARELQALRDWKNANCIGMEWLFEEVE